LILLFDTLAYAFRQPPGAQSGKFAALKLANILPTWPEPVFFLGFTWASRPFAANLCIGAPALLLPEISNACD
jgi:hypothetical protein